MLKTLLATIAAVTVMISAALIPAAAPAQTPFRPVAIVNDSAITGFDLDQRAQILATLGFPAADRDRLRREALDRLVEDRLKTQEGARLGITASDDEINEALGRIAERAGISANELIVGMRGQGVSDQALRDMVAADVVWRRVVRSRFSRRIDPSEAEIDAEIAQVQSRAGATYKIAEIGLPATGGGRTAAETEALAEDIYTTLSQGGDFAAAVKRYSRSPSARNGGLVGWVESERLPPDIAATLAALQPGEVTRPFPVAGGVSILRLLEVRTDETSKVDTSDPKLREQVSRQLQNERAGRLADGLLQELRRDALIEIK